MRATAAASTWIKAPRATVSSILTDVRRYQGWLPDVTRSRLLAREGGVAIAELVAPIYGNEKILLEMVESTGSVRFTQVDRYREEGLSGHWTIEDTERGEGIVLALTLVMRRRWLGPACRRRLRAVADRTVSAVGDRALRLAAGRVPGRLRERREILAIERSADGLRVRLDGREYEWPPRTEADRP